MKYYLRQHNTKRRKINRAWVDAGSGHAVGKDEYRILKCCGKENSYLYDKVCQYEHQECHRMYCTSAVMSKLMLEF